MRLDIVGIVDRAAAADAVRLVEDHGGAAPAEAQRRAGESRDRGNVVRFCHWRSAARLAAVLVGVEPAGTRH